MPSPVWSAATPGQAGQAGQINQLLTTHPTVYVYAGSRQAAQTTAGSGSVASNGLYVAQSFTTAAAQATVGYAIIAVAVTGSPSPWQVTLQAGSGGSPSGTALAAAQLAPASGSVTVLLPATGLASSTQYWLVAEAVGDSGDHFAWSKSNAGSGAATSADGVTWSPASYGLLYQLFDGTTVGDLVGISEDGGARQTVFSYASGLVSGIGEVTAGQTAAGFASSSRSLAYSGGLLTGVA